MYLKIMDAENAPDDDSRKTYRLLADVIAVKFSRVSNVDEGPHVGSFVFVRFKSGEPERFDVPGNAYLMNESGKTISSWGSASFVPGEFPSGAGVVTDNEAQVLEELERLAEKPSDYDPAHDPIRIALDLMKRRHAPRS